MITKLPGQEHLNLLPLLLEGSPCKHGKHWCIMFNGELYVFRDHSQFHKDAWVAEARCQIGLAATMAMLHHFCPVCHTLHI